MSNALDLLTQIEENVSTCCAITMEPNDSKGFNRNLKSIWAL